MSELEVINTIKELSTEGIANVMRKEINVIGYSMPREDLEQLAQYMVNSEFIDELDFIIESEQN